jgi:hypothetical protein
MRFAEKQRIDGSLAFNMLSAMQNSDEAIFRYKAWPTNYPVDITVDLHGFRDLLSLLRATRSEFGKSAA